MAPVSPGAARPVRPDLQTTGMPDSMEAADRPRILLSIVVPCFNEQEVIGETVRQFDNEIERRPLRVVEEHLGFENARPAMSRSPVVEIR